MTEQVIEWIKAEKLIAPKDRVIAGVSGGADSVCLLRLLLEIQKKMEFTLEAVHVEHGIRGEESREDAAFVRALCDRFHVPCHIYAVDVPAYAKKKGIGLEEAARSLRYECYRKEAEKRKEEKGTVRVALAHHADDNAETLLFHLIRGSGIAGLGGMQAKRSLTERAEIIRPLLNVQRREIEAYLREIGQEYRKDSTNADVDYSRNRIRHNILPELCLINEQAVSHMNRSAGMLRQAADYLAQQAESAMEECCVREIPECGERIFVAAERFLTYPVFLQNEMLYRILAEISGSSKDIGEVHVETVRLLFPKQVGRSLDLPYGVRAERVYGGVRLTKAAERGDGDVRLTKTAEQVSGDVCLTKTRERMPDEKPGAQTGANEGTEYRLGEAERRRLEAGEEIRILLPEGELRFHILEALPEVGEIHKKKYTKWLNYDKIKDNLQIRKRKPGDYLTVDVQGHKKKLKEYFVNEKIPREIRDHIWLLAQEAHVLWVIGGRISADFKIIQQTKKILEVQAVGGNYYED